ncbi:MAG: alpha/beta fold hydrolase [Gammaproteobacteria bacterium]|nr:alpha/beta fold hydrolase [Gammaproteobacteria bacterium]NIM73453.1 alpha/beta fold hydrolase [Gammaproteobacteria bacterium]NIN39862.1 alpha/beta fold hydrolase [Gammaproteobacteria bacterium]NIO25262.1 alpha/beta fold hydrolase [Gammaproteobacteria bacterium]NIO65889.1 alpha/beta fold hydrolase [Gammaproteobacteria bacterium]
MAPETRYTKVGDVHIAYQVVGDGPLDLVVVPGWVSHLEVQYWEEPIVARFFERLATFSRLILFDKRGTGLSDRVAPSALPTLEQRMEDVNAVMDAVGSSRAALFGISEGGAMCALFAATYPDRVSALVMSGCFPKWIKDDDYPWAPTREQHEAAMDAYEARWGTPIGFKTVAPSVADDERCQNWWARNLRMGASPADGIALYRMNIEIDIRAVLPTIGIPTLILHRAGDRLIDVGNSRYMAEHIPGAKYVELEGSDHLPWFGDASAPLGEIQEFLTGVRPTEDYERILTTVLLTDVVGSTAKAASIGDAQWRNQLEAFYQSVRQELARFRGTLIRTTGDGVLATFDGPARAVRCGMAICRKARSVGLEARVGIHTGEVQMMDEEIGGITVHIAARVMDIAGTGEVLVSSTVKDITAGAGIEFEQRGTHTLKGVPDQWQLFSASD